jgi:hypothetical protein
VKANFLLYRGADLIGGGAVEIDEAAILSRPPRALMLDIEKGIGIVSGLRCKLEITEDVPTRAPGMKQIRPRPTTKKQAVLGSGDRGYTTEPLPDPNTNADFPADLED